MFNEFFILVVLLALSGFFSSAETALFSISMEKAKHAAKDKNRLNVLIMRMKNDSHTLLTTILIGNNLVNVGASALATVVAIDFFEDNAVGNAVGIATGVMTLLILVFGEIFPKSIATRNNIMIARIVIFPIYWLSFVFYPVIKILDFIPKISGKIKKTPTVTEEELITIVEAVEEEGVIKEEEKELIRNIFDFDDINSSEIMTPRADMFVLESNKNLQMEDIIKSGFTRIPVIEGDIDHIIGIVHIKDLFRQQVESKEPVDIREVMRKPYFIPENKKLDTLLRQFKRQKQHMAIVVDEHGGVAGLITLEDVIEEIVGEISDETDKFEPHIVKVKSSEWIVLGKADIGEINKKVRMNIGESKEYDTFSGYVLEKIGRIPSEKERFEIDGFMITVKEMDGNRIMEFIVKQK